MPPIDMEEERRLARARMAVHERETRLRTRATVILGATRPGATRQELEEAALSNYGHLTDEDRAETVAAAETLQQERRGTRVAPDAYLAAPASPIEIPEPAADVVADVLSQVAEAPVPDTKPMVRNRTDLSEAERLTVIDAVRKARQQTGRGESPGVLRDWIAEETGIHLHLSTFNALLRAIDNPPRAVTVAAPTEEAVPERARAQEASAPQPLQPAAAPPAAAPLTWTCADVRAALEFVGIPADQVNRAIGVMEFIEGMAARRGALRA